MPADPSEIARPLHPEPSQLRLFAAEPDWRPHWWGMPSFDMGDARPRHRLTMNFMTAADLAEFARVAGLPLTTLSDSAWYPPQDRLGGRYVYDGPRTPSRYPVCIPSKGRATRQTTARLLDRLGVAYTFFVEETEHDAYCAAVGEANVVRLPFHDLGQGSTPARNFIWAWAAERGHRRHWTVDDNLVAFYRTDRNRRVRVFGGGFFAAMEDFVDRYENVALAGPHSMSFVADRNPNLTPYLLNSRVYSCILADTTLPHRWRGRYNEDTDLSLRVLKDGHCTLLFRALAMSKPGTTGSRNVRPMAGGNTDHVYNADPTRRAFAESLRDQHPDVVRVVWKFNRWHHLVDYTPFAGNQLRPRPGVVPTRRVDDYGMALVRREGAGDEPAGPKGDR